MRPDFNLTRNELDSRHALQNTMKDDTTTINTSTTNPPDGEIILYFDNGTRQIFQTATDIVDGGDFISFKFDGKKVFFKKSALAGWALPA